MKKEITNNSGIMVSENEIENLEIRIAILAREIREFKNLISEAINKSSTIEGEVKKNITDAPRLYWMPKEQEEFLISKFIKKV